MRERRPPFLDDSASLRVARRAYLASMWLPEDGGYDDRWVSLKIGPVPFAIPNTASRRRAVRLHDLHHVLTGYRTDWPGEFEISAFEIASGCRDYVAAWVLNLGGLAAGALLRPRRTFRAFQRGRRARNLYREGYSSALLGESVGAARARLGLDAAPSAATAGDVAAFAVWTLVAWAGTLGPLLVGLLGVAALR